MKRAAVLAALALLCAACGSTSTTTGAPTTPPTTAATTTTSPPTTTRPVRPSTTTTTEAPTAPTGGGVVVPVYVAAGEAFSFSPWSPGFVAAVGELYLAGAGELDPASLDFVPDLLSEMPTTDNGGVSVHDDGTMTVSYRIRPEAVWEDGTPVSGDDFAFTYETIVRLPLPDDELALYQEILPETVAAGEKTFSYTLPRETIDYERLFRVVLPRHIVAGTDPGTWTAQPWASAGPFRFGGWVEGQGEAGSVLLFVRNEAYWQTDRVGRQLPYLDEVEFRVVAGPREAVEAFARGQADIVELGNWPDVVARLEALSRVAISVGDGTAWEHVAFQFGPNDDNPGTLNASVDFRRAVAHALDRPALVEGPTWVNGGALSSFLSLSPARGTVGWDRYSYDPALAATLLQNACLEADRDCTAVAPVIKLTTTSGGTLRAEAATRAEEMLEAAGFDVRIALEEPDTLFGPVFEAGSWDVGLWAWELTGGLSGLVRTLGYWDPAGAPPAGLNYQRWGTAAVEGYGPFDQGDSTVVDQWTERYAVLLGEMRETADRGRLLELITEAEEILADQVVVIPLATRGNGVAWWSDTLAGARRHPARPPTWNVERWYRADG